MRGSYILIALGIIGLLVYIPVFFYYRNYFDLIGGVISVLGLLLGIYWENENRKTTQLNLEENRDQHLQIFEAVEKIEDKYVKISKFEKANNKLRQLMNKVTLSLQKENFSKEELLRKLNNPIYCLLFHKTEEASLNDKKLKTLRDEILPSLGFKFVRGSRGIYVLPPSQIPLFKDRKEIENWIQRKIMNRIPSDYRYIFSFVSLIDLRFTISINKDKLTKKYDTLLETINAEELLNFSQGLSYLRNKKDLSIKEIIELPNLYFLLDGTSLDFNKKQILKDKNEEIFEVMKKDLKKEIFTKDLINIDSIYLLNLLKKYCQIKQEDIKTIKTNAQFWKDLLDNKLIIKK